jgi:hypothetical protein
MPCASFSTFLLVVGGGGTSRRAARTIEFKKNDKKKVKIESAHPMRQPVARLRMRLQQQYINCVTHALLLLSRSAALVEAHATSN